MFGAVAPLPLEPERGGTGWGGTGWGGTAAPSAALCPRCRRPSRPGTPPAGAGRAARSPSPPRSSSRDFEQLEAAALGTSPQVRGRCGWGGEGAVRPGRGGAAGPWHPSAEMCVQGSSRYSWTNTAFVSPQSETTQIAPWSSSSALLGATCNQHWLTALLCVYKNRSELKHSLEEPEAVLMNK